MKTLRNPQPYGEQTTGPLTRNCVSSLALDPWLLVKYAHLRLGSRLQRYSAPTDLGSTLSTAPESTNASYSSPPRVLSLRSVTELTVALGHRPNPNQSDHCQHHWTAQFRLHPRPDNLPLMGRAWQDDPFHHTCCR